MHTPHYPLRISLWFDNQAQEAAELYCSLFDNAAVNSVNPLVTTFHIDGIQFMGINGGPHFTINPSISLFVKSPNKEHLQRAWDTLIVGGKTLIELGEYPWSECYGWLQDKYGVTWQIMLHDIAVAPYTVTPCMLFINNVFGRATEALEFYAEVFNSDINFITKQFYQQGTPNEGKLMFADCTIAGNPLIAMDGPDTHDYAFNEAVSFVIDCDTQEEIDYYWNVFTTNGGAESHCGWCKDKFGVSWQIIPRQLPEFMNTPEKAQRVTAAFMPMHKLELATLQQAAESI